MLGTLILLTLLSMTSCYLLIETRKLATNTVAAYDFSLPVEFVDQGLKISITEDYSLNSQYQACNSFIKHNLTSCVLLSTQLPENHCRVIFSPRGEDVILPKDLDQIINQIGFNIEIQRQIN